MFILCRAQETNPFNEEFFGGIQEDLILLSIKRTFIAPIPIFRFKMQREQGTGISFRAS